MARTLSSTCASSSTAFSEEVQRPAKRPLRKGRGARGEGRGARGRGARGEWDDDGEGRAARSESAKGGGLVPGCVIARGRLGSTAGAGVDVALPSTLRHATVGWGREGGLQAATTSSVPLPGGCSCWDLDALGLDALLGGSALVGELHLERRRLRLERVAPQLAVRLRQVAHQLERGHREPIEDALQPAGAAAASRPSEGMTATAAADARTARRERAHRLLPLQSSSLYAVTPESSVAAGATSASAPASDFRRGRAAGGIGLRRP